MLGQDQLPYKLVFVLELRDIVGGSPTAVKVIARNHLGDYEFVMQFTVYWRNWSY